jgi:Na+-translocating ferredoxin:NAD+ oxidoreductase RnfG subunit
MCCWDTSSRRAGRIALAVLGLLLAGGPAASAKVFLTTDEALRLAFPGSRVERRTSFLTAAQLARAEALAGVEIPSKLVHAYLATSEGRAAGTAYFDTHRVRTLPETVMVVLDPAGKVRRVEVLAFGEPPDYLPRGGWYGQFAGKELGAGLSLKRDIRPITGATLTARATTGAVRRVLAIHQVLGEQTP